MASNTAKGYGPSRRTENHLLFDGKEENFEKWEVKLLAYLSLRKLKKTVLGQGGSEQNGATKKEEAFSEIVQLLDDRSLSLVMRDAKDDGKKALDILREHYAGRGKPRVMALYGTLLSLVKRQDETLTDYIIRADNAANALRSAEEAFSDELLVSVVLRGLPEQFRQFKLSYNSRDVSFTKFKSELRSYEENERASLSNSRVMYNSNKDRKSESNQKRRGCFTCGKEGHKAANCPSNSNSRNTNEHKQNKGKWCSVCNRNNHTDKECFRKKKMDKVKQAREADEIADDLETFDFGFTCKVSTKQHEVSEDNNNLIEISKSNEIIVNIDEIEEDTVQVKGSEIETQEIRSKDEEGYLEEIKKENEVKVEGVRKIENRRKVEKKEESLDKDESKIAMVKENKNEVEIKKSKEDTVSHLVEGEGSKKRRSLLVDTGATSHIINEDDFIAVNENYVPENHFIELADGSKTNAVAKKRGTVLINIADENGVLHGVKLEDTLYCPGYPQNIFSVKAATKKKDARFVFSNDYDELTMEGTTFPIHTVGELYFLYNVSTSHATIQACSLETWHKILGHCNKRDILKLEKVVEGMKITDKKDIHCETCVVSKQTENKSRTADPRAKSPLDFVHSDVAGPIEPISRDGHRYVISFTDDYSSALFVYFMRTKDDATEALQKFIADSAPHGKTKRMRTDNGGEYVSKEFEREMIRHEIRHEGSAPYCPHQNGTAERGFRTLFEMARCMLYESGVPRNLWSYALMTAVFVRNSCYSQRTGETPYFMLNGRKPNLRKMKIFGTVCYGYIHEYKKKLDDRSEPGLFVGYDKNTAAYLVYYPETKKIKRHGMVTFTNKYQKDLEVEKRGNPVNQEENANPQKAPADILITAPSQKQGISMVDGTDDVATYQYDDDNEDDDEERNSGQNEIDRRYPVPGAAER